MSETIELAKSLLLSEARSVQTALQLQFADSSHLLNVVIPVTNCTSWITRWLSLDPVIMRLAQAPLNN